MVGVLRTSRKRSSVRASTRRLMNPRRRLQAPVRRSPTKLTLHPFVGEHEQAERCTDKFGRSPESRQSPLGDHEHGYRSASKAHDPEHQRR